MAKQIYLSSTYKDLKEYRETIRQMFTSKGLSKKYELVSMEGYVAESGKRSLEVCLDDVRKADIYVLVLAGSYGSTVDGSDISYTQAEYEEAKRIQEGRHGLYDIFVFYSSPEFEKLDFAGKDNFKNDALKAFYNKATTENACFIHPFSNPDNLCNQILLSLNYAYEPVESADDYDQAIMLINRKPPSKQFKTRYRFRQFAVYFGSSYYNYPNDFLWRMYDFELPAGYYRCMIETAQLQASDFRKFKLKFMGLLPDFLSDGLNGFDFESDSKVFISLQITDSELKVNKDLLVFLEQLLLDFLPGFLSEQRLKNNASIFCLFYNYRENDEQLLNKFSVWINKLNALLNDKAPSSALQDISDLDDITRTDVNEWLANFIRVKRFGEIDIDKILNVTGSKANQDKFNMKEVKESLQEWINNSLTTQKNANNR